MNRKYRIIHDPTTWLVMLALAIVLSLGAVTRSATPATWTVKSNAELDANQAQPGDTVIITAELTRMSPYAIRPGVKYTCSDTGKTIGRGRQFWWIGSGVNGAAMDMKGASLDGIRSEELFAEVSQASNFTITRCDIGKMTTRVAEDGHVIVVRDANTFKITGNQFQKHDLKSGEFSLLMHQVQYCEVSGNIFEEVREAINIKSWIDRAKGVVVTRNFIRKCSRFAIEIQETDAHDLIGYDGLIVSGNWYADVVAGDREASFLSIVPDNAINTVIEDNFGDGGDGYTGHGKGGIFGIEHKSKTSRVSGNRLDGFWVPICLYGNAAQLVNNSGSRYGNTADRLNKGPFQNDGNATKQGNDFNLTRIPGTRPVSPATFVRVPATIPTTLPIPPPVTVDDAPALQALIEAARAGDTITLVAGKTYRVSWAPWINKRLNIVGNGATLLCTQNGGGSIAFGCAFAAKGYPAYGPSDGKRLTVPGHSFKVGDRVHVKTAAKDPNDTAEEYFSGERIIAAVEGWTLVFDESVDVPADGFKPSAIVTAITTSASGSTLTNVKIDYAPGIVTSCSIFVGTVGNFTATGIGGRAQIGFLIMDSRDVTVSADLDVDSSGPTSHGRGLNAWQTDRLTVPSLTMRTNKDLPVVVLESHMRGAIFDALKVVWSSPANAANNILHATGGSKGIYVNDYAIAVTQPTGLIKPIGFGAQSAETYIGQLTVTGAGGLGGWDASRVGSVKDQTVKVTR